MALFQNESSCKTFQIIMSLINFVAGITWKILFQTYRSCFESARNEKAFDGSQPYEILNSTGISQLVFEGSGTYQFQLRVVGSHLR